MAYSQLVSSYLGVGTLANRPSNPNVASGVGAFYYATDTGVLYLWTGAAWSAVSGVTSPSFSWVTKTANYTLLTSDTGILADATSANLTLTLPTAVGATALYTIKKKDSSTHTVTLATTSSQTIDGFSSVVLADQLQAVTLMSDGSNWYSAPTPTVVPAVRCYNSTNISLPTATDTALTFDSNRFDQGTITPQHSTSIQTSRLTAQVAGIYQITGHVQFASNATGYRQVYIRINGATPIALVLSGANPSSNTGIIVGGTYQLAVGDYAELMCLQSSGGALNVTANGNWSPEFGMTRLG